MLLNSVLQKTGKHDHAFQLPCYKVFRKYLIVLGQYPYQTERSRVINMTVVMCCLMCLLIPSVLQFFEGMQKKDLAMAMEAMPYIATVMVTIIKLLNHNINKKRFENLYDRMKNQWVISERNGEIHVLKKIVNQGSKMATLYRTSLWAFAVVFILTPLSAPVLDMIVPLNDSRTRSACSVVAIVTTVVTIDSFYMVIFHYICGMFALCGHQVKKATEILESCTNADFTNDMRYDLFRRCVNTHHEAIRFYEYMNDSTRISYLLQVGLSMSGITSTSVLVVLNLDRPDEAFNVVMFLLGQQFHLFTLSLPGQVLLDQSFELTNDIYDSKWHQIPQKCQKMLQIMLLRSNKVCKLTAGGLYEMNIENFGIIFKTCMSYFTVLLSLRE